MDSIDNIDQCCKRVDPIEFTEVKLWIKSFSDELKLLSKDGRLGPEEETRILDEVIKMANSRRQDIFNECFDVMSENVGNYKGSNMQENLEENLEELRVKVIKYRNEYHELPFEVRRDMHILRFFHSSNSSRLPGFELLYGMSMKDVEEHYVTIGQNKEYWDKLTIYNLKYYESVETSKKFSHALVENEVRRGRKYSKEELALFGFDKTYVETVV